MKVNHLKEDILVYRNINKKMPHESEAFLKYRLLIYFRIIHVTRRQFY